MIKLIPLKWVLKCVARDKEKIFHNDKSVHYYEDIQL